MKSEIENEEAKKWIEENSEKHKWQTHKIAQLYAEHYHKHLSEAKQEKPSNQLLLDVLAEQRTIISSPLRFEGVHIEKIKQVFEKYGIKYSQEF